MKPVLFCVLLLTASASAQLTKPIDVSRSADANGKIVTMPTVSFDSVPQPTVSQPVSPLTGQVRERAATIETKSVTTHSLSYSTIPVTVLPQQNFIPKRGVVPTGGVLPTPRVD